MNKKLLQEMIDEVVAQIEIIPHPSPVPAPYKYDNHGCICGRGTVRPSGNLPYIYHSRGKPYPLYASLPTCSVCNEIYFDCAVFDYLDQLAAEIDQQEKYNQCPHTTYTETSYRDNVTEFTCNHCGQTDKTRD